MSADRKLYEGKAKILYSTEDSEILLTHFKDDATAFNAQNAAASSAKANQLRDIRPPVSDARS